MPVVGGNTSVNVPVETKETKAIMLLLTITHHSSLLFSWLSDQNPFGIELVMPANETRCSLVSIYMRVSYANISIFCTPIYASFVRIYMRVLYAYICVFCTHIYGV